MKLLDRYLIAQFAKNLLLVLCSLLAIYLLIDFFERVDNFFEAKKSVGLAVEYLFLKVPFMFEQLVPVCILLAGIITLGILNHHFEFMALMASGISVPRIIRPLLVAACLTTLLAAAIGEWILPATMAETNKIWYEEVNRRVSKGIIRDGRTYFKGEEGIYSFIRPNAGKHEFRDFSYTSFDEQYNLKALLTAKRARWENNVWYFDDGQLKQRIDGRYTIKIFDTFSQPYEEKPDEFFVPEYKVQELSYSDLWQSATSSKENAKEQWLEFHRRFSYIFLGVPLLLMGIPVLLAMHKTKGRDLALAIPVSCGIAFAVWGGWSASQSMAKAAYLAPGLASWSIHLVAGALGIFLIARHKN